MIEEDNEYRFRKVVGQPRQSDENQQTGGGREYNVHVHTHLMIAAAYAIQECDVELQTIDALRYWQQVARLLCRMVSALFRVPT